MKDAATQADAASLSRLHDLVSPPPVSWWPPAPGWFVVGVLLLALLIGSLWRLTRWWRANAYRREALALLKSLPAEPSSLPEVDELLKRVALSVYPREQVASLSGTAWLEFLDRTAGMNVFVDGPGRVLGDAAYVSTVPESDVASVVRMAESWVRHHQGQVAC